MGHNACPQNEILVHRSGSSSKAHLSYPAKDGAPHDRKFGFCLKSYSSSGEVGQPPYDVTIVEDLGNGETKITFIGNEPMDSAKNSGQLKGWNQILDKLAAVVEELAQAK